MIKIYNTNVETNVTSEQEEIKKGCWINMVSPSEKEIKLVCEKTEIEDNFIRYALDIEEKARIDIEDDGTTLFVIDIPVVEKSCANMLISVNGVTSVEKTPPPSPFM